VCLYLIPADNSRNGAVEKNNLEKSGAPRRSGMRASIS